MKRILAFAFLAVSLVAFGLACDSASPVAPTGTLLSISASPNEIGTNGTSSIRVTALRSNGTPVNPGTIIRLDTTLGTIDEQVETDDQGVGRATLTGDGRVGTATVTARSGSAEAATVDVMVGKVASSVSLQATPPSIPETGGTVELLALVRDDQGQQLAGATVNFTTEIGTLASSGGFQVTDSTGQASDVLTVLEDDIDALAATTNDFEVGVEVGGSGSVVRGTFNVRLESAPLIADFEATVDPNNALRVLFTDLTSNEPNTWFWIFGDGVTSQAQNPSHTYQAAGTYSVTLKVTRGRTENEKTEQVTVGQ
jgi:hypothetical protein